MTDSTHEFSEVFSSRLLGARGVCEVSGQPARAKMSQYRTKLQVVVNCCPAWVGLEPCTPAGHCSMSIYHFSAQNVPSDLAAHHPHLTWRTAKPQTKQFHTEPFVVPPRAALGSPAANARRSREREAPPVRTDDTSDTSCYGSNIEQGTPSVIQTVNVIFGVRSDTVAFEVAFESSIETSLSNILHSESEGSFQTGSESVWILRGSFSWPLTRGYPVLV